MTKQVTIDLDDVVLVFLDRHSGENRSEYINKLFSEEAIGYRISPDDSRIPLYYGEIKINADNQYHVIPRRRPSEE